MVERCKTRQKRIVGQLEIRANKLPSWDTSGCECKPGRAQPFRKYLAAGSRSGKRFFSIWATTPAPITRWATLLSQEGSLKLKLTHYPKEFFGYRLSNLSSNNVEEVLQ